jgi:hypothetical protein
VDDDDVVAGIGGRGNGGSEAMGASKAAAATV